MTTSTPYLLRYHITNLNRQLFHRPHPSLFNSDTVMPFCLTHLENFYLEQFCGMTTFTWHVWNQSLPYTVRQIIGRIDLNQTYGVCPSFPAIDRCICCREERFNRFDYVDKRIVIWRFCMLGLTGCTMSRERWSSWRFLSFCWWNKDGPDISLMSEKSMTCMTRVHVMKLLEFVGKHAGDLRTLMEVVRNVQTRGYIVLTRYLEPALRVVQGCHVRPILILERRYVRRPSSNNWYETQLEV